MKKPFLLSLACLGISLFSNSQTNGLHVIAGGKGLFVEHIVTVKENFYSIGREFNVHPKHLAAFNGLDILKGLSLGQLVNIPLSDTNLSRKAVPGIPVYYQSSMKQTVGAISAISKTPSDNLRQLNNLSTDNIPADTKLIIGYLLSDSPGNMDTDAAQTKVATEEKKQPDIEQASANNAPKGSSGIKMNAGKEESGTVQPIKQDAENSLSGDGYFKAVFAQQVKTFPLSKEETVTSGIFKTTSGWGDAKYYALIDGIEPGTIIKVANPGNNKVVYAKVLGQMTGIRQNQGLNLRISNAAASALEIAETDKFIVKVNY